MNNMLDNLKEKMNETVLKDVDFNEKNKENVLLAIKKKTSRGKLFHLKPKLDLILSISASCLLLFGIGYFSANKLGLINSDQHSAVSEEYKKENQSESKKDSESNTIYTPPKQEEYYEDMKKEEVLTKLINSIDYFHTAVGKFDSHIVYPDHSETTTVVEYKISTKNKIGGYEKATLQWDKGTQTTEIFYNDQQVWQLNKNTKSYYEYNYPQQPDQGLLTVEEAFSKDSEGTNETKYRVRPPIGPTAISLFPYEIASNYTRNYDMWEIEKQNEELLGHNTIVLKGKIENKAGSMYNANSFRFWVDKDTGILIKYETYLNGEVNNYLYPEKLEINVPIDLKEIEPRLDGYKKTVNTYKYDSREEELQLVESGENKNAKKVIEQLKEVFPLYEFTHPDFELNSATYEKFRDYNQGYLNYQFINRKPDGTVPPFLRVREYHKESFLLHWGDFDEEKTKVLGPFTLNDIEWEGFKINDSNDTQFIGHKGEFIYEVVSIKISFEETRKYLETFKPSK